MHLVDLERHVVEIEETVRGSSSFETLVTIRFVCVVEDPVALVRSGVRDVAAELRRLLRPAIERVVRRFAEGEGRGALSYGLDAELEDVFPVPTMAFGVRIFARRVWAEPDQAAEFTERMHRERMLQEVREQPQNPEELRRWMERVVEERARYHLVEHRATSLPSRYASAAVVRPSRPERPLDERLPLRPAAGYAVSVRIGRPSSASLISSRDSDPLPESLLPPAWGGHWIELAVGSPDLEASAEAGWLFLPLFGSAWSCPCRPGQAQHTCEPTERIPFALLRFRTPGSPGTGHLRLGLYHDGHLLQSFLLTFDVAEDSVPAPARLRGNLDYTASDGFTDVSALRPRALSLVTNDLGNGTHTIYWKGGPDEGVTAVIAEGQLADAMGRFRARVLEAHLAPGSGEARSAYGPDNGKPRDAYLADLARLAVLGRTLTNHLRGVADRQLPRPGTANGTAVVQVARVRNSSYVFPWAGLYDLPLDDPPADTPAHQWYAPCAVVANWQRAVIEAGYPAACPYAAGHGLNTLCPYGFWGFRCIIEVPPAVRDGGSVPQVIPVGASAEMAVGRTLSPDLDQAAVDAHVAGLSGLLPGFEVGVHTTAGGFGAALADPELELVYLYAHGLRESQRAQDIGPVVEIGDREEISTHQIHTWAETVWVPEELHWKPTAPLVVINGCHTVEISPSALVSFVDAFAAVRSAGVVGTEVMLHQSVAAEAAERFFTHFAGGEGLGVGEAIRRMRLDLLGRGNVMGLAYTPYCSADLRLARPPSR
jgi:hypothetical protein